MRPAVRRLLLLLTIALGVAILVRTFVAGVFVVPTASMAPTLLAGDRIVVNRLAYGLHVPFGGLAFARVPVRGDVVVFEAGEGDARAAYVKRVVGLPGDTVSFEGKALHVNGVPVRRELVGEVRLDEEGERRPDAGFVLDREIWEEHLDGRTWTVATHKAVLARPEGPFAVPAGHLFLVGDDRDVSEDSRRAGGFGPVPLGDVVGRAVRVLYSVGERRGFRRDRLLEPVR